MDGNNIRPTIQNLWSRFGNKALNRGETIDFFNALIASDPDNHDGEKYAYLPDSNRFKKHYNDINGGNNVDQGTMTDYLTKISSAS